MLTSKMNLDKLLCSDIMITDAAHVPDVFGIEVELEGKKITQVPDTVTPYWRLDHDGSLRKLVPGAEAIEYILRKPLNIQQTEKAIQLLFSYLTSPDVVVFNSYRTSIHVHVNYAQETHRTIYNSMVLSIILDQLLVSQNGEHRIGNNFCLRSKDAMGQVVELIKSIGSGHNFFDIKLHNRYSSINFASLFKFGSIEYRSLECTTHEGRLMHWIGTLQQIKEKARTFKNPVEIVQKFSMFSPKEFLYDVLGPYSLKYAKVDNVESMLYSGMRIAQDLAFCSSWNEGPA